MSLRLTLYRADETDRLPLRPSIAHHRREYIEPTSSDNVLVAQRTYRELDNSFEFGFKTNAYQLRSLVPSRTNCVTTFDDEDYSGDYDPLKKEPKFDALPTRISRIVNFDDSEDESPLREKREKTSTWLHGRHNGYSKAFKIKFSSEVGKSLLKDIGTASHVNWPEEPSKFKEQNFTDISQEFVQDRKLRERRSIRDGDYEDGDVALKEELQGHPAARGCIPCARHNLECSLLSNGYLYPCQYCKEDGCECELFTQPKFKDGCLNCRKAHLVCSYRKSNEDHDVPCKKCQKDGKCCLAGPKFGNMRRGPSYEFGPPNPALTKRIALENEKSHGWKAAFENNHKTRGWKNSRTRKKSMVDSSGIVKAGRRRPVKGKPARGQGPNVTDTDQSQHGDHSTTTLLGNDLSTLGLASQGTPLKSCEAPPNAIRTGGTKWTTTCFPYPILFNATLGAGEACKFCANEVIAMLGYGEVKVEVSYTVPAEPYYQISGGHPIDGPTSMCSACTTHRVMIALCKGHDLVDLENAWIAAQGEVKDIAQYLTLDREVTTPFEWCSLCVSPAKAGCCAEQGVDADGDAVIGCGLRLCELCEFEYEEKCGGNMEELITMVRERDGCVWYRADLDFLRLEGHMMSRLFAAENGVGGA